MNNEYIVVIGGRVVGDSSQHGPAIRTAEKVAAEELGAEVIVYQRVNVYKARTIVESDAPKVKESP